jgi:fluoride exporter
MDDLGPGFIVVGSALGAMVRFWLAVRLSRFGQRFPWSTLAVNVTGALAIGLLAARLPDAGAGGHGPTYWHIGALAFLGSYTTVSSFSLETLALLHAGERLRALANITLSIGLCLAAAGIGLAAGGWLA